VRKHRAAGRVDKKRKRARGRDGRGKTQDGHRKVLRTVQQQRPNR